MSATNNNQVFLQNNSKSKDAIYRYFAPKMYGICLRFAGNEMEAQDILHDGFIKVFSKLDDFRNDGSFEGWIRRTMINTAINFSFMLPPTVVTNRLHHVEV